MRRFISLLFCLSVVFLSHADAQNETGFDSETELPLSPEDIRIVDVDPESTLGAAPLPEWIAPIESDDPALAPFTGIWRGQWEGTLDTYFAIVEVKDNRVKVFHSWGSNVLLPDPGMRYVWGTIHGDVLLLPGDMASISLRDTKDGTLFGLYYSRAVHMPSRIVLTK
ncbi:MAG: hypothetical protein AAFV87_16100 [Pseudomonadota bacterium]